MLTGFETISVTSVWRGESVPDLLPLGFEFWWRGQKFRHKPGGCSDGLSSPQFTHLDPDIDSRDWAYPPAVAHDGGYHDAIEMQNQFGEWVKFTFTKDECDTLFKELMDSIATDDKQRAEALAFYEAVHLFGQTAFNQGRSWLGTTGGTAP
jgi:hypothetical protein